MADISRVVITGGDGMIGQELSFGIKLSHKELDVTNINQIGKKFSEINPAGVVCLSSLDINSCEQNPAQAYDVNVFGVYNVACEASRRNIPLIIISSGAVFNGSAEQSFSEDSVPDPQNVYGQTKYLAEIIVKQMTKNYLIIRTGWIFGTRFKKKGFSGFVDRVISSAKNNEIISATIDQRGSPMYISDFSNKLKELVQSGVTGTVHVVNDGDASASDVAKEIISITGGVAKIRDIGIKDLTSTGIKRSMSEVLTSNRVKLRTWQEALNSYVCSAYDN